MLHWAIICLFYFCMFLLIPGFVCLLHSRGKISFEGKRGKLLFFFLYSLFSWCFVNALIWGSYFLTFTRIEGPEAAFALLGGWLYLWITSIPVFLLYGIFRMIRGLR